MIAMTALLLLPGSDGRSSIWREVARGLRSAGSDVSTYEGWSRDGLAGQVAAVLTVCQARNIDSLVTWSYSGLVGSLVAASHGHLSRLVHVDALLPGFATDGKELRELVSPAIMRLLGHDWQLATAPAAPSCAVGYIECLRRPAKPSFRAVARSAAVAHGQGFTIHRLPADHRAMTTAPTEVVSLLQVAAT